MTPHSIATLCCAALLWAAAGCCPLLPGKAALVTEHEQYVVGDEVILTLCNRSGRVVGNLLSKASLQRRGGPGEWEVVRLPSRSGGGKVFEITLLEGVKSCAQEHTRFRLPRNLPPGEYRFRMPTSAGEYADFESIENHHAVSETFVVVRTR